MVTLRRWLSALLSALVLVAAFLGPLGLGHIRFHVSRSAEVQYTFITVVIMATSLVLLVVTVTATQATPPGPRALTATRWFVLTLGTLFASLWAMQIAQVYGKEPAPAYEADPALFWLIKFLDYSFLIPALVMVGVALPRWQAGTQTPSPWARPSNLRPKKASSKIPSIVSYKWTLL